MSYPFLLYNGVYIKRTVLIPDYNNIYHFLLIGVAVNHAFKIIIPGEIISVTPFNKEFIVETTAGKQNLNSENIVHKLFQIVKPIILGSETLEELFKLFFEHKFYKELIFVCVDYCNKIGFCTTSNTVNDIIFNSNNHIDSVYWKIQKLKLESCKPKYHEQVLECLFNKKHCIVTGGTGTGKTVMIPKLFWYYNRIIELTLKSSKTKTVIAFPRKSLAVVNFKSYIVSLGYKKDIDNIDNINGTEFNLMVGYKDNEKILDLKNTNVKEPSCVIGTSESLFNEENIKILIIDEFHEHDIKSDFLFSINKKTNCQFIIVTATPSDEDILLFKKFFPNHYSIHIEALLSFPIKETIVEINTKDKIYVKIKDIMRTINLKKFESILVFLPTVKEVIKFAESEKDNYEDVFTYYGDVSVINKEIIESKEPEGKKTLIVATSAAESSITFRNLTYVIDSGLEIKIIMSYEKNLISIPTRQFISYQQYQQRRGRSGRTKEGIFYSLYNPITLNKIPMTIFDFGNPFSYILIALTFDLVIDDLFMIFTEERRKKLEKFAFIISSYLGSDILPQLLNRNNPRAVLLKKEDLLFYSIIEWPEQITYFNNINIPIEDKQNYLILWDKTKTVNELHQAWMNIIYKTNVPSKQVIFTDENKYIFVNDNKPFTIQNYKRFMTIGSFEEFFIVSKIYKMISSLFVLGK